MSDFFKQGFMAALTLSFNRPENPPEDWDTGWMAGKCFLENVRDCLEHGICPVVDGMG